MHLKTQAIGRLGRNPEVKMFDNGGQVVNFSIATTEYKGKEKGNVTTWVDVAVWNKVRGDFIMNYVKKGGLVFVEGTPGVRAYEKDGQTRGVLTLTVGQYEGDVKSLSKAENQDSEPASTNTPSPIEDPLDGLPDWD